MYLAAAAVVVWGWFVRIVQLGYKYRSNYITKMALACILLLLLLLQASLAMSLYSTIYNALHILSCIMMMGAAAAAFRAKDPHPSVSV